MTALLIMCGLWVGSAALVIPYLLHVAKIQVEHAAARGTHPDENLLSAFGSIVGQADGTFLSVPSALDAREYPQVEEVNCQLDLATA
jgi:hypothetical protein